MIGTIKYLSFKCMHECEKLYGSRIRVPEHAELSV